MMIQLEKLKAIQLENDQIIITELTKKQKELLQSLLILCLNLEEFQIERIDLQ
jgi:hypothetical protein